MVAIVTSGGAMKEWVKYSSYGIPFGLPAGDTDSDGDCDSTDVTAIQKWTAGYDVRYDLDLDGNIQANDASIASGAISSLFLPARNRPTLREVSVSVRSLGQH